MKQTIAIILTGLTVSASRMEAADAPASLSVDVKHPGAAIAPDYTGLSFEVSLLRTNEDGVRYFRPGNQPLITLFHTLGIKSLRIGGNTSDRDVRQLPDNADLDSLYQFAKAAGVKVIYCLRLHNGDPQVDAATAKYIMDHYAAQVDCFSIGQEPSAYPVTKGDTRAQGERMGATNEKYQYTDYEADWKRFADVLIAAVPDIKFCGPSVHNNGVWAQKFMTDFGRSNHVTLITEHLYPGGAGGKVPTPENGRDRMLASDDSITNGFPKAYKKLYDSFVPMADSNGLPCRLEEVNNYFNGGATNVSNTFASALWGLDFMYWWAAHGLAGLNFHTGDKVAAGYELRPSKYTAYFSTTNGYNVRPLGYGIKAFDLGSHGRFVPVTISNSDNLNLSVYGVLGDDHYLYITVINKEHGADGRGATITLDQNPDLFKDRKMVLLSAPDNDVAATTGETLGGGTIDNGGSWAGKWLPLANTLEVPPATAAIVKLTPK